MNSNEKKKREHFDASLIGQIINAGWKWATFSAAAELLLSSAFSSVYVGKSEAL